MGSAAAQEGNETAANESVEWPTDPSNVSVDVVRDALEEPPEELPTETIRAIGTWATDLSNIRELGASEREQLNELIDEAQAREVIDGINLPDLERDQSGDDDRDERTDDQAGDREDELEDDEEVVTNGTGAGLEHQEPIRFNDHVRIVGWEIRDGRITIAIESERRTEVTVADALAGIGDDGAVRIPETEQWLERHETTTVRMDLTEFQGGASASVTVDGLSVRLSSEMDESDDNPLRYFGGESGLFTGMLMSIVMSGAATGFVLWREESGVIRA